MSEMKERAEIAAKYKWDLTAIYPTPDVFEADIKLAEELIARFPKHEKSMTESAGGLLAALRDMTEIESYIQKLWQYASLSFSVDMQNNEAQAMSERVRSLAVSAAEASWFVSPRIIKLDEKTLREWLGREDFIPYRRVIEKTVRMKPHTLGDEGEIVLSKLEDSNGTAGEIRSIFANSDLRFGFIKDENGKKIELTDTNYVPNLTSSDRAHRRRTFKALYKTYEAFGNTFATMYASHIKEECAAAKVRGFKSSIVASTYSDEVTPDIYNSLIRAVHKGMGVIYDYYELKREVLGVERLHMYDLYTPLISELDRKYSYEEAVDEVLKTVGVYGEEYEETLRAGLTERGWVDVYPSRGKRGGAFSSSAPTTEPYILLNYTDTYNDISTLAHEAGHSMHSWYSAKHNEPHNSRYTIFVAEVASTVNELLLAKRKLRESTSREEKLFILNELMETYKSTLYRQTMFAEFERDMHAKYEKGEPLTRDVLCSHYYKLISKYFGGKVAKDKEIQYEWMRIPHFYSSFYVYKYATCISAASAIVKRIENEGESYVRSYLEFLSAGDSKSPLDSLKVAGIDMTDPEVVFAAIDDFANAIKSFRELYNEGK